MGSRRRRREDWGNEQEALIRRNLWIDPRDAETKFGEFVGEWRDAISSRLEPGTLAKYDSVLDNHVLPQWGAWPLIGVFNSYIEIEKWVSELHQDYADSTVATIFATFSTVLNAAVRAHMIPANPCSGVRVTSGEFSTEHLVASPVQALRAAVRLYTTGLGLGGLILCLLDFYTGARWGELGWAAAARVRQRAAGGWIDLPPSIAVFYEELLDSHRHPFVLCTPEGAPWRRSNFRQRHWRPAWDGVNPDNPSAEDHTPAILPWFTFHEGRHTTEDGVPEVARRAAGAEDEGHRACLRPRDAGDAPADPGCARRALAGVPGRTDAC